MKARSSEEQRAFSLYMPMGYQCVPDCAAQVLSVHFFSVFTLREQEKIVNKRASLPKIWAASRPGCKSSPEFDSS
jgi:hypothetical protein